MPSSGSTATQRLQQLLDGLVARRDVAHAIVAVERGDRSFRWIGAAGEATLGGEPMRSETPFFVASVDKLFTATAVMKLCEAGRLALDAPISAYLPHPLIAGLHRSGSVDRTDAITVRNLLGHTSGLADYLEDRPRGGRSLVERLAREGDRAWNLEDSLDLVRDELKPHFPPQPSGATRQKVRYSDTNYLLLIAILEEVAARRLHEVFAELLFLPLGMRHTYLPGHSRPLAPTPEPGTLWFGRRPLDIPRALASFPSVYSTAEDTLAFLRALVAGQLFDDPRTLATMQERWNRFGLPLDRAALREPSWPIEYGLGLMRFALSPALALGRRVPALVGHTGSTGSWLLHCAELDLLLSGTVDQGTAGALPFRFLPKLLRALAPPAR